MDDASRHPASCFSIRILGLRISLHLHKKRFAIVLQGGETPTSICLFTPDIGLAYPRERH